MPTISGTISSLKSRISSIDPYNTTYTYLKYCNNYIIGYGNSGIQILKRDCVYGGIRDVRVAIKTQQEYNYNLNKIIRGWGQAYKDLGNQILGELYKGFDDLDVILKGKAVEVSEDINKIIRGWAPGKKNLNGYLKKTAVGQENLPAYLKQDTRSYLDLNNRLKGWFIESKVNLRAYTKSVIASTEDLSKYIRAMHIKDLNQSIGLIPAQDLQIIIQHNDRVVNLFGNIRAKYYNDIIGIIRCKYIYDLPTILIPIVPVDLSASLAPILYVNLGAFVDGWLGPLKNLTLNINAVPYKNLAVSLSGWGGYNIPIDLRALIASYQEVDLSSSIGTIPAQNLSATLIAKGQSENLALYITPKVINFRSVISVSLLEHKDLNAMINYACFYSDWVFLGASLYCFSKKDIILRITGTLQSASNTYKNLGAMINVYDYYTEDSVIIDYPVVPASDPYTLVNINFNIVGSYYRTVSIIPIYYYGLWTKNLSASITSIPHSRDLSAYINPEFDYNYTELPSWINPRTREVVIDIRRQSIETKRFIELMFETFAEDQFHYFYVNAEQKVYRVDRDRHWTIKAIGYTKTEDENIERIDVREKTVFSLAHYSNIDEAVRSIIDRAASYREVNLPVQLVCTPPPHYDLPARLNVLRTRSWQKNLHLYAHGLDIRNFVMACRPGHEGTYDLHKQIYKIWQHLETDITKQIRGWLGGIYDMRCTVRLYKGVTDFAGYIKQSYEQQIDLYCDVEGMEYVPPEPGNVIFNFVDDGYVVPIASGIELEFGLDALTWDWYEYVLPVHSDIRVTRSSIEILRKET